MGARDGWHEAGGWRRRCVGDKGERRREQRREKGRDRAEHECGETEASFLRCEGVCETNRRTKTKRRLCRGWDCAKDPASCKGPCIVQGAVHRARDP